jgi:alkylmercury lyase
VTAELDNRVRVHVYEAFVAEGRPPEPAATAQALDLEPEEAEAAYARLAEARVFILAPNTTQIWAVNPLCATPSAFPVEAGGRHWYGICIWDALGIPAMLGTDGTVTTPCPDCGDQLTFEVRDGQLVPVEAVVHFAVPARRWWENIAFT